jgi:hypothetical protein
MHMGKTVKDLVKERPMSLEGAHEVVRFFARFTMDFNTDMGFLVEAACILRAEVERNG